MFYKIDQYIKVKSEIDKLEKFNEYLEWEMDTYPHVDRVTSQLQIIDNHEELTKLYKEKSDLELIYEKQAGAIANFKHYAITIGCNNNDIEELDKRFKRFTSSSYCKEAEITYFYEISSYLHIHMYIKIKGENRLKRSADIRKRYGVQLDGTKANFDIRYLKSPHDIIKWKNYIQKAETKENLPMTEIPLSGFFNTYTPQEQSDEEK